MADISVYNTTVAQLLFLWNYIRSKTHGIRKRKKKNRKLVIIVLIVKNARSRIEKKIIYTRIYIRYMHWKYVFLYHAISYHLKDNKYGFILFKNLSLRLFLSNFPVQRFFWFLFSSTYTTLIINTLYYQSTQNIFYIFIYIYRLIELLTFVVVVVTVRM